MQVITEHVIAAEETRDGADVRIKRLFPTRRIKNYDPFVLLDEFFLEPSAGFPQHPHRGFEVITFMLEGGFHHTDTMGNDRTVFADGAQYFVAGKGIEHSEMPGTEGENHGIQLWVNLPRRLKGLDPSYQQFDPEAFPIVREGGQGESIDVQERTIVGPGSPLRLNTNILYRDLVLLPGAAYMADVPSGMRGLVYVISGSIEIGGDHISPGEAYLIGNPRVQVSAALNTRCLFLAGEPHREPIHQHGSFVD